MEAFVKYIVAGGLALLAGLWLLTLQYGTLPWGVGLILAVLGVAGLGHGIRREIDAL